MAQPVLDLKQPTLNFNHNTNQPCVWQTRLHTDIQEHLKSTQDKIPPAHRNTQIPLMNMTASVLLIHHERPADLPHWQMNN